MTDFGKGAAWMGGEIVPIAEARIGVTDWGLTHSDIAYDVVPVWNGGFFRLNDYLDRFEASMAFHRMDVGMSRAEIHAALEAMVARSGLRASYCAMVASRGSPAVFGSRDPRDCRNHFYAWCAPYINIVKPEIAERGATLWIPEDVRRIPADSVNPLAKNYHWGDFTQGLFQAHDRGFDSVALLDHDGNVTEGPGFNVFIVKGDRVVTSDHGVLHGITRKTVIEMAEEAGLTVETRPLPLDELMEADEVFISTSGGGVHPVRRVRDRVFSNDRPGPVSMKLRETYHEWRERPEFLTPIAY